MGGARCYVTLFEAPFQASVLNDSENNALRASSLMVIPPPPPGSQPLAGSTAADLLGNNLTQWASDVQEVTSYMWWPPEAAVRCPVTDIIGVLNRLEGLTRVPYCWSCFGIGPGCQCSVVPHQAPGPMAALWIPPTLSYSAMVSSTKTTASTSCGWSDSPESLTTERARYQAHGHIAVSYYGELAGNCRRRPGPQAMGSATSAPLPLVSVR